MEYAILSIFFKQTLTWVTETPVVDNNGVIWVHIRGVQSAKNVKEIILLVQNLSDRVI